MTAMILDENNELVKVSHSDAVLWSVQHPEKRKLRFTRVSQNIVVSTVFLWELTLYRNESNSFKPFETAIVDDRGTHIAGRVNSYDEAIRFHEKTVRETVLAVLEGKIDG